MTEAETRRYRSVFISDVHLGTRGCQAELLLDFIRNLDCDSLYLVGDIVDGWKMKTGWYWPQAHNDVVQKVLRLARRGVAVIYVPGNHDEVIRDFCGVHFGGVVVARDAIHETADGRRFLVTHGDEFDAVVQHAKWLAPAGRLGLPRAARLQHPDQPVRRRLGFGYWSFSAFAKTRVKKALQFIENFEQAVADEARRRGVDGVICGHIHKAEMRRHRRHRLHQRRRLGGKLHRAGRARGRPPGNPGVGQDPPRPARGRAGPVGGTPGRLTAID